ncbi:peroxidase [Rathayibacter toxicus]|uniref:Deferrochelatase n=1 Tax=Rathayibacter toxicus TaxID=145458 RepID=A0A0C5BH26_9MICO|nr:peroxidase [Rathayibacter toxicus]ALS58358.1 peroxidase [Rathayibacter toxicus]KKM47014.1 peroxidase [Rathayibacter toxicus]
MDSGTSTGTNAAPVGESATEQPHRFSRRGLLGLVSAGTAGLAVGAGSAVAIGAAHAKAAPGAGTTIPFFGNHQAGVTTAAQDRLHFAAFDLAPGGTRDDLIKLLRDWTIAASRLTQGLEVSADGAVGGSDTAPPDDTGEALGLDASSLTVTFGFGPTLFSDAMGTDRFGLASRRPPALEQLPRFRGDALVPAACGGDLCIQACADDPQVAVHAIRNLSRIAFGRASLRWSQLGFGRTSSTSSTQTTPRNLFGFKDGTANVKSEETDAVTEHVWVPTADGPDWLAGGSYLVARKIRMMIEIWDHSQLGEQERVIGRSKGSGAPLSGGTEFTDPDFTATGISGAPLIDKASHVRLAHPSDNNGIRLLRRGYNFVDGNDELGRLNAGLFFLSFQRSPQQFVTVQRRLANDALNEYIKHVGSAIFAIPPGAREENDFIGSALFA